jgi:AAA15 family ATPase/GTPase
MLGLALAIVNAKNGVLLVDEIDTGLHYTVMSDMWKMIWKTAKRLNVQVFATTNSNDCWHIQWSSYPPPTPINIVC